MRHHILRSRACIPCITLLILLSACQAWRVQEASPRQLVEEQRVDHVRVLTTDGTVVTLSHPSVRNDSLVDRSNQAVALTDVSEVSVKRTTTAGWIVMGTTAGLTLVTIAGLIALANTCFGLSC